MDFPSTVRTQQQQNTTSERLPNSTEGLKSLENYLGLIIDYLQLYLISTMCKHVSTGQTLWVLLQRALSTCAIDVAKVCRWSSPPRRLPGWTGMTHRNASWRQPKIMLRHTVWSCCTRIAYLQHMPILYNTIRKHTCKGIRLRYFLCIIQTILWYCTWYTNVFYVFIWLYMPGSNPEFPPRVGRGWKVDSQIPKWLNRLAGPGNHFTCI